MMKKKKKADTPTFIRLRNLIAALNRTLGDMDLKPLPARVREIPDERTARFYTTLGLLSPPARFDGRRALYGRKHLIELLAIKRLQSRKLPIREIQARLRKASESSLAEIAGVESAVIQKALQEASRDPSLNLWPRPASETPALGAPGALTRPASAGVGDAGAARTWGRRAADPETPALGAPGALTRPGVGGPARNRSFSAVSKEAHIAPESAGADISETMPSIRSYRVAAGVYLTIDRSMNRLPPAEIQNRLQTLAIET